MYGAGRRLNGGRENGSSLPRRRRGENRLHVLQCTVTGHAARTAAAAVLRMLQEVAAPMSCAPCGPEHSPSASRGHNHLGKLLHRPERVRGPGASRSILCHRSGTCVAQQRDAHVAALHIVRLLGCTSFGLAAAAAHARCAGAFHHKTRVNCSSVPLPTQPSQGTQGLFSHPCWSLSEPQSS